MRRTFRLFPAVLVGLLPLLAASCASAPPPQVSWVRIRRAEWGRGAFESSCQVLRREYPQREERTGDDLRDAAVRIGASAVLVETRKSDGDRTTFLLCPSIPTEVGNGLMSPEFEERFFRATH